MSNNVIGTLLVTLQFGILSVLAALCLLAPTPKAGYFSYALWSASAALGIWAIIANPPGNFNIRPEPKARGRLVTSGPYRWVRHPMYLSVLLLAAGAGTWLMNGPAILLGLGLLVVLVVKARIEETWLLQTFLGYAEYRQRTHRLIPWIY